MILNHLKTPDINRDRGNDKKLFLRILRNNQVLKPVKGTEISKWRPRAILDRQFF